MMSGTPLCAARSMVAYSTTTMTAVFLPLDVPAASVAGRHARPKSTMARELGKKSRVGAKGRAGSGG